MHEEMADRFAAVLAEAEAEQAANAAAIATAVYSGVTLPDRLRAALGLFVVVHTADGGDAQSIQGPSGTVEAVVADAVRLQSGPTFWVVPFTAMEAVRGLPPGHKTDGSAMARLTIGHLLRPLAGATVLLACGSSRYEGVLRRVGADHLEISGPAGPCLIAMKAITWVRATGHTT